MNWFCPRCGSRYEPTVTNCPRDGWALVEDVSNTVLVNKFHLHQLIGVGGMGSTVWQATQTNINRPVAVKLLPPATDVLAKRFAREARIASSLNHPHIVTVHDYGQTPDNKLYLVMELLEGHTLQHELSQCHVIPPERAIRIVGQILRALEHAHSKQVVHRDLKPGNLFLCSHDDNPDYVKVVDFGLAKSFGEDDEGNPHRIEGEFDVTGTRKVMCGTPNYMAPEQLLCSTLDNRCDLYAVGVVLYRMLIGEVPFAGKSRYDLYRRVISMPAPEFSEIRPNHGVSRELELAVRKALNKQADDRYHSARDFRTTLNSFTDYDVVPMKSRVGAKASSPSIQPQLSPAPSPVADLQPARPTTIDQVWWRGTPTISVMVLVALSLVGLLWHQQNSRIPASVVSSEQDGTPAASAQTQPTAHAPLRPVSKPQAKQVFKPTPTPTLATRIQKPTPSRTESAHAPPHEVVTAQAQSITIELKSSPAGASVAHRGVELGSTPLTLSLDREVYELKFTLDGHVMRPLKLDLTKATPGSSQQHQVTLALHKKASSAVSKKVTRKKARKAKSAHRADRTPTDKGIFILGKKAPRRSDVEAMKPNKPATTTAPRIHLLGEETARPAVKQQKKKLKVNVETLGD